jgi:hypothetical protein
VVVLLCASWACAADSYVAEPAPALAFKAVSPELAPDLDSRGIALVRYLAGKRVVICNVWWRSQLALAPSPNAAQNVVYGSLRTGELLGVVQYLVPTEDFQHHVVRPGLYSMRYAQLDQDGSDSDGAISPYRDFVVLSPMWADHHVGDFVALKELLKRSHFVTREDEPAVLSLVPVNPAYKKFPWAVSDDRGFCTLQALISGQTAQKRSELALAVILVRPPYENEGS